MGLWRDSPLVAPPLLCCLRRESAEEGQEESHDGECGRECEGVPVCVSVGGSVRVCRCVMGRECEGCWCVCV